MPRISALVKLLLVERLRLPATARITGRLGSWLQGFASSWARKACRVRPGNH